MHIIKYSAGLRLYQRGKGRLRRKRTTYYATRLGPRRLRVQPAADSSAEFMRSIDRHGAPRYSVLILLKFLLLPGRETFFEKEILNNHSAWWIWIWNIVRTVWLFVIYRGDENMRNDDDVLENRNRGISINILGMFKYYDKYCNVLNYFTIVHCAAVLSTSIKRILT